MLLKQKLTSLSAAATHQEPEAPVKEASTAPRHLAAPPSSGLDYLGGTGGAEAQLLHDGPRRHYKQFKVTSYRAWCQEALLGQGPLWAGLVASQSDTCHLDNPLPGGRNLALRDSLQGFAQGCYSW